MQIKKKKQYLVTTEPGIVIQGYEFQVILGTEHTTYLSVTCLPSEAEILKTQEGVRAVVVPSKLSGGDGLSSPPQSATNTVEAEAEESGFVASTSKLV